MRGQGPNISIDTKTKAAQLLLESCKDGQISRGRIKEVAALCGISTISISSIWSATRGKLVRDEAIIFEKTVWSKHKDKKPLDYEMLKAIPFRKRTSYRRIAREIGVSKSLVGEWVKDGLIKPHTNAIKPILTDKNKLVRLVFCLSQLDYFRTNNKLGFKSMHNTVHIDEKWFYITQESVRYYKADDEPEPHRACKSKRYITKLMFMCAVTRPVYSDSGECLFDGKIGIFPFTKQEATKRNSKNRPKGTMETKSINTINKKVIQDCLVNQIIQATKLKWPQNASKDIFIQQDNARSHIKDNDEEFRTTASSDGFNIQLVCQPSNSPDTNVNDLGFFRAIQSLQYETASYTIDDLLENIMNAFENLSHEKLDDVFLSLQCCMVEILKHKGHNDYTLPHMGKERLKRGGQLPDNIEVDQQLVRECMDYLRETNNQVQTRFTLDTLMNQLGWMAYYHLGKCMLSCECNVRECFFIF